MRRTLNIIATVLTALIVCGCPVHQWPEPNPATMILHLRYEPDLWVWPHSYDPAIGMVTEDDPEHGTDEEHPGTSGRYSGELHSGVMRIVVRAYLPGDTDNAVKEYTFTRDIDEGYDCDLPLDLDDGDYNLIIWADMRGRKTDSHSYDPSDFHRVRRMLGEEYKANSDHLDTYRGQTSIELRTSSRYTKELEEFSATMRRPMAKYEFITTDLSEFLEQEGIRRNLSSRAAIEDYVIEVNYSAYLPSSYSAVEDRLENSSTGVRYSSEVLITGESEASIGFDYVLLNKTMQGSVMAEISVYDMNGERVARSQQIKVPLRRDHHTVLRGAFMTILAQGGVGVDPDYDGDHNVTYP